MGIGLSLTGESKTIFTERMLCSTHTLGVFLYVWLGYFDLF